MPLVEPDYYSWQKAVELVTAKQPDDEDATKNLIDALAAEAIAARVLDDDGEEQEIPSPYWALLKAHWEKYGPIGNWATDIMPRSDGSFRFYESDPSKRDCAIDVDTGEADFECPNPSITGEPFRVSGLIRIDRAGLDELLNLAGSEEETPAPKKPDPGYNFLALNKHLAKIVSDNKPEDEQAWLSEYGRIKFLEEQLRRRAKKEMSKIPDLPPPTSSRLRTYIGKWCKARIAELSK